MFSSIIVYQYFSFLIFFFFLINQLFSMIDMKPPISRAKMMSVTKSAIKAIKLYKHVVQIVEKFIKKCKPELKVPGLYVVDSIVRQSRHQFGVDKDVFGPRFLKNFGDTFQNLYRCSEDDKSKILRVLNLWQKNGVFDMDVIQPLMDMANGAIVPAHPLEVPTDPQPETQPPVTSASVVPAVPQLPTPDALAAVAQLFQSPHGQELQRMLQNFQQADKTLAATMTNNIPNPAQMPAAQLNPYGAHVEKKSSLAEKLLDRFDYDDEPEEMTAKDGSAQSQGIPENLYNQFPGQMSITENVHPHMMGQTGSMEHGGGMSHGEHHMMADGYRPINEPYSQSQVNLQTQFSLTWLNERKLSAYVPPYFTRKLKRRLEYEARRQTQRVRQEIKIQIWFKISQEKKVKVFVPLKKVQASTLSFSLQRMALEISLSLSGQERKREGQRAQTERSSQHKESDTQWYVLQQKLTYEFCSTTLWVGQLDKKTQQSDVMSLLEEFGQIESINMIPPRGCAYIVMVHRQDAYTALNKLSRGSYKVNQKPVKIAWALNKGIKSAHKKFWDVERGVTYIPWSKVKLDELESYREGGILDPETLNPEWNNSKDFSNQAAVNGALDCVPADGSITAHIQAPPVEQAAPIRSPPAFPGAIMMSPTSMPPVGAPFIPTEFDPTKLTPGSIKLPEESPQDSTGDKGTPSDMCADNQLGSPVMTLPGPGVMQGPRPGMPPLQSPPGLPNPHLPPFLSPPNMPHMAPQMMPGAPMFPPDSSAPMTSWCQVLLQRHCHGLLLEEVEEEEAPPVEQAAPIRSPPAFPGAIMMSPTSMPPVGAPFIPTEFDPTKLTPGSIKLPEESPQDSTGDKGTPSDMCADNQLGSPVMTLPGPGVMQGPRPGMPPLQSPPGLPNPHLPPFLSPPNMPHMAPQMMPGAPMFPPDRFRMPMHFPPRGPPFHQHPSMGPESMDDREGRHFRNGRPGFGCPPFQRGRW
ncbi:hypothetical protein L3Q82_018640 [Scortum barcoo]|uniref:Uncharacterized protein n=1 Tax=Scortum barcoo TaxID=214431 RepID=A0ACB8VEZ8_9TELE|nr:hypothetical protein L3Q82_018640 [Scortum barcoo]